MANGSRAIPLFLMNLSFFLLSREREVSSRLTSHNPHRAITPRNHLGIESVIFIKLLLLNYTETFNLIYEYTTKIRENLWKGNFQIRDVMLFQSIDSRNFLTLCGIGIHPPHISR